MSTGEAVYLQPAPEGAFCAFHDSPTQGLAKRLVLAMRESRGAGSNVCVDCVRRARGSLSTRADLHPPLIAFQPIWAEFQSLRLL